MLQPGWQGRRVSVRRAVVAGSSPVRVATADVVGDLLELTDARAVIETGGGLVEIDLAHVVLARLSPPSTRDVLALEAVAARGWRAAHVELVDGWWHRADPGGTRRANSVLPLGRPRRPLAQALQTARAWYSGHGQALRLQIPLLGRSLLDAELREQGWSAEGADTRVVAVRTDRLSGSLPEGMTVEFNSIPDEGWWSLWRPTADRPGAAADRPGAAADRPGAAADRPGPATRALVARHPRATFASVRAGGQVVAVVRAVVDDGWLGLTALEVAPDVRRRGVAGGLLAAVARHVRGAGRAYAQVELDNAPALALYDRLGFWTHHEYRFLLDP